MSVRSFLCPFLYFNKTLLHKSSWVIKPGPWSRCYIFSGHHESSIVHRKLSLPWDLHGLAFTTPKQWLGHLHLGRPTFCHHLPHGQEPGREYRRGLSPCPMAPRGGQGRCPRPSLVAPYYILCATSRGLLPPPPRNQGHSSMEVCKRGFAHSLWVVVGPWKETDSLIPTHSHASSFCTEPHKSCGQPWWQ